MLSRLHPLPSRYGAIAVLLHWLIAILVFAMLGLGVLMTELPASDPHKFGLYQWHKSFGVAIFGLSLVRAVWRLGHPAPPWPTTMTPLERRLAAGAHAALYGLSLVIPLTGWLLVSASPWNIPTRPFGAFTLPHLPWLAHHPDKQPLADALTDTHAVAALLLAVLLAGHIAAALRHHFFLQDEVLTRMLPMGRRRTATISSDNGEKP